MKKKTKQTIKIDNSLSFEDAIRKIAKAPKSKVEAAIKEDNDKQKKKEGN